MEQMNIGDLVISEAGHDKGFFYIIVGIDREQKRVKLADGVYKLVDKPKIKNIKHICFVEKKFDETVKITDLNVKRAIKLFSEQG
ncbi:MAG: KOW domain-containing RNA-binding protein [Lachnospiraceae bacterium]|jgi:hypothetical protein|nr:KOW domain-containing RNA-binding protein [Lachnospiraceae bacterium]MBQ5558392.1 KOW domain-containing RNA-binding protein [Lachnospiraceae bacterium]MCR4802879.1 KOW domain-containing RNA-binding protein [Lachnospiraceae bacterium]